MTGTVIQKHVSGSGNRSTYEYRVECDGVVDQEVYHGRDSLIGSMDVGDVLAFPLEHSSAAAIRGSAYNTARRRVVGGVTWWMRCKREGDWLFVWRVR